MEKRTTLHQKYIVTFAKKSQYKVQIKTQKLNKICKLLLFQKLNTDSTFQQKFTGIKFCCCFCICILVMKKEDFPNHLASLQLN